MLTQEQIDRVCFVAVAISDYDYEKLKTAAHELIDNWEPEEMGVTNC